MTPVNRWIVGDRWFASVQKIILEMCTTSPRHFRLVVPNYSLKNWLIRHLAQNEYPLPDITTPDELIFSASGIPASGPNPVRLHHLRTQFIRSFEHQYPDLATRLSIAGIWNQFEQLVELNSEYKLNYRANPDWWPPDLSLEDEIQRYLKLLRTHHIGTRQTAYDCLETWGWRPVSRAMAQYTVMIIIPPDPTPKLYRLVQAISAGADLTIGVVITNEPDTLPVDHLLPGWDIAISQSVTIPTPDSATRLAPVEWWTAETAQSQYDTVARFIHDATKTHPLSDIGIVLPSLEYHAVDVIQKLTQLGVPVYSPIPISLSETWPGCLASAILNIIRSRADIESVSNWLNLLTFRAKTSISSRDVAQLKSIAKSTSIPLDFDRWPDLLRHPKIPESLSRILTEILPGLARGKVTAFSTIMDHLKSQFSSSEWDPETALAIGSVLNLVGELRRLVPSESIETVAEIGLKAINSVSFSAPEYGNGIQVCSLTQAATIPLPIWIWLDAIDSRWPSPSILETRLGTSVCNAMGISVGDQRYREWEKHCRSLLRQAQEKTIIISPTELDGECHSPSYLIESAVLDLNLSTTRHHCLPDQAALISRTLTEDRGNVDTWPDAAPYQNQISSETVGLLIQNRLEHSTSVSTLEQYQRCPYQYLLNRLLKLGQPPIEDNDTTAREAGIIVHNAMETLIRLLSNAKGDAPETRIQNAIQWLETGFLTQISALRPSPIASAIHRRWVGTLQNPGPVRQLVPHLVALLTDYEVEGTELPFGPIQLKEGTPPLTGFIDLLLRHRSNHHRLIVDYKTRESSLMPGEIRNWIHLQLPLYMLAASKIPPEIPCGIGQIWQISAKTTQLKTLVITPEAKSQIKLKERPVEFDSAFIAQLLNRLSWIPSAIQTGRFNTEGIEELIPQEKQRAQNTCKSCDFHLGCRFGKTAQ